MGARANKSRQQAKKSAKGKGARFLYWLVGLVLALGVGYFWAGWRAEKGLPEAPPPVFEERVPKATSFPREEESKGKPIFPSQRELPLVAIVIDDLGYQKPVALGFIDLEIPLTLSLMPQAPFSREIAKAAFLKGKEILLHIPMEPKAYPEIDPGPGVLLTSMTDTEIQQIVEKALGAFPNIVGVNNHMGSRFTEDQEKMAVVLRTIKGKKLFFLDSRTTSQSTTLTVASQLGVKAIERDLFLDHIPYEEAIRGQLEALIRLAQARGSAVGCGHPYPQTLRVIKEKMADLRGKVNLVPLSRLLLKEGK